MILLPELFKCFSFLHEDISCEFSLELPNWLLNKKKKNNKIKKKQKKQKKNNSVHVEVRNLIFLYENYYFSIKTLYYVAASDKMCF